MFQVTQQIKSQYTPNHASTFLIGNVGDLSSYEVVVEVERKIQSGMLSQITFEPGRIELGREKFSESGFKTNDLIRVSNSKYEIDDPQEYRIASIQGGNTMIINEPAAEDFTTGSTFRVISGENVGEYEVSTSTEVDNTTEIEITGTFPSGQPGGMAQTGTIITDDNDGLYIAGQVDGQQMEIVNTAELIDVDGYAAETTKTNTIEIAGDYTPNVQAGDVLHVLGANTGSYLVKSISYDMTLDITSIVFYDELPKSGSDKVAIPGTGFTGLNPIDFDMTAEIESLTPIAGLSMQYGLILTGQEFSNESIIDGYPCILRNEEHLYPDGTKTGLEYVGKNVSSHFVYGAEIKRIAYGDDRDLTRYKFVLTFVVQILPNYFGRNTDTDKLVAGNTLDFNYKIEALRERENPNEGYMSGILGSMGNVGWYDENFNGSAPKYSLDGVTYTSKLTEGELEGLSQYGETEIEIIIKTTGTAENTDVFQVQSNLNIDDLFYERKPELFVELTKANSTGIMPCDNTERDGVLYAGQGWGFKTAKCEVLDSSTYRIIAVYDPLALENYLETFERGQLHYVLSVSMQKAENPFDEYRTDRVNVLVEGFGDWIKEINPDDLFGHMQSITDLVGVYYGNNLTCIPHERLQFDLMLDYDGNRFANEINRVYDADYTNNIGSYITELRFEVLDVIDNVKNTYNVLARGVFGRDRDVGVLGMSGAFRAGGLLIEHTGNANDDSLQYRATLRVGHEYKPLISYINGVRQPDVIDYDKDYWHEATDITARLTMIVQLPEDKVLPIETNWKLNVKNEDDGSHLELHEPFNIICQPNQACNEFDKMFGDGYDYRFGTIIQKAEKKEDLASGINLLDYIPYPNTEELTTQDANIGDTNPGQGLFCINTGELSKNRTYRFYGYIKRLSDYGSFAAALITLTPRVDGDRCYIDITTSQSGGQSYSGYFRYYEKNGAGEQISVTHYAGGDGTSATIEVTDFIGWDDGGNTVITLFVAFVHSVMGCEKTTTAELTFEDCEDLQLPLTLNVFISEVVGTQDGVSYIEGYLIAQFPDAAYPGQIDMTLDPDTGELTILADDPENANYYSLDPDSGELIWTKP
jgi:hypothetical protein